MADVKISALPTTSVVNPADIVVLNQSGTTKTATKSVLTSGLATTAQISGIATTAQLSAFQNSAQVQALASAQIAAITPASIGAEPALTTAAPLAISNGGTGRIVGNYSIYGLEIHVGKDGNDTTGDGTLINPVLTITKALTLVGSGRNTIVVHPGSYSENPTVSSTNTTISTSELTGANTLLSGTLTLSAAARVSGLKMSSLAITGTGNAYISNCTVDTSVTKSGSNYVEIINSELQCTSGIAITGAGVVSIVGNKCWGVTVANASANVLVKDCFQVVAPNSIAGNLQFDGCAIFAAAPTTNAVTSSAGSFVTLANSFVLNSAGSSVERISLLGSYSILNLVYDKANSTLTGTNLNAVDYFSVIDAETLNLTNDLSISNGGTGASTAIAALSNLGGITSAALSGFATTSQVGGLNSAQVQSLTSAQISAITPGSIGAVATSDIIAISKGGTGSTDAVSALSALGAAGLASPAFTGTPTAPTAAANTNTTQLATTEFVISNRGDSYLTTSASTNTISNGTKTFTVEAGLSYTPTQDCTIVFNASNHMHGVVVTYSSTTLVVDVTQHTGSGSYSVWTINVGGLTTAAGALLSANNLSDVANTATALTNIGGVSTARSVSAGTGLTGGGDLTANRTLSIAALSPDPTGTYGSTSQIPSLTVNNLGQVTAASSLAMPSTNVQVFSTPGTFSWTKPDGAKQVVVELVSGGNGGGAGGKAASGTAVYGGTGAGGGGYSKTNISASDLEATCSVVVGAAGSGSIFGGAVAGVGGASSFANTSTPTQFLARAASGATTGQNGGTTAPSTGSGGAPNSNAGGSSSISGNAVAGSGAANAPTGGGGGGGISAVPLAYNGGSGATNAITNLGSSGGNASASANGASATSSVARTAASLVLNGSGGGGGGASTFATGSGGNGANGSGYGSGGGGGGATIGSGNGGNGGNGAPGIVVVTTYF